MVECHRHRHRLQIFALSSYQQFQASVSVESMTGRAVLKHGTFDHRSIDRLSCDGDQSVEISDASG